jgi:transposase
MFNHESLFSAALMIQEPLYVKEVEFNKDKGELHIYVDFRKGSKFKCSICGADGLDVHDTIEKTWRHLNFFQYKAYIHYRNPRSNCPDHGVHLVEAPWGTSGTGFTLLFEALVMQLAMSMPVSKIADLVDEHDTKIWRIIQRHVNLAHLIADYSDMKRVGIDETSSKRGHKYVTLFVDMDASKVVYVAEGKDSETISEFKENLPYHNCNPQKIETISADMSPAFKKGIDKNFPWADVTFDKFHIMKLMNEAVDKVRKIEQKTVPELRSTKYLWLYNPEKLSEEKATKLESLKAANIKTAKVYQMKLTLQDIYATASDRIVAMQMLDKWYKWAVRCRLEPVKEFAKTIKNNWSGVINYFDSRLTNAVLEGINSIIQAARARAKGYRNTRNFITMIYLLAGKLTYNFHYFIKRCKNYGQPKVILPT